MIVKGVRLDPGLEERVRRAAAAEHSTVSEFVRAALAERADRTLREQLSTVERLSDVIGIARSGGPSVADRTGEAFADLLEERHRDG